MNSERELFERYEHAKKPCARKEKLFEVFTKEGLDEGEYSYIGKYVDSFMQEKWELWCASSQRQGYKLVLVDDTNIMDMIYGKCPCGSSRSPIISDKEGYSLIHCFACGANKYIHKDY